MTRDLARLFVHLYPRAWRARYEDELVALLEARDDIGWRDAIDIVWAATRQWGSWIAALPTREPANDLKSLSRQARAEWCVLIVVVLLLDLLTRAAAAGLDRIAHPHLPGFAGLCFLLSAAMFRCLWVRWWPVGPETVIGARELGWWCVVVCLGATLARLDPGLSARATDPWLLRLSTAPTQLVWTTLLTLMQSTAAARARTDRRDELLALRRRNGVPSRPLGL